jgi:hypothetical protein
MRNRPGDPPVHPLGPILLAGIAAVFLWCLYHFFGIGRDAYEFASAAVVLYGGAFILTMLVAAVGFAVVWLVAIFSQRR